MSNCNIPTYVKPITSKMALKLGQIRQNGIIIPIHERLYMYASENVCNRTSKLPVYSMRRKRASKISNNATPVTSVITQNNNIHRNNVKYSNLQNAKHSKNEFCSICKDEVKPRLLLTNILNDEIPTMVELNSPPSSYESYESARSSKNSTDYYGSDRNTYGSVRSGKLTCDLYQPSSSGTYYKDCHIEISINHRSPQNNIDTRSESFYEQESSYETVPQLEFNEQDILNLEELNDDLNHSYLGSESDRSDLEFAHHMDSVLEKIVPALLKKVLNINL